MTTSAQASVATIERFLDTVGGTEKQAETAHTEPGSQGGETSHPVKNVDDRTEVAKEGERSAENTSDVKEDQGAPGVDSQPEAKAGSDGGAPSTPGSAADDHLQINANVQATGDDPSTETSSAKAGKEDPGSSHEARTDNDALDGHKYSADQLAEMPLTEMAKIAADLGNKFCSALAAEEPAPETKTASDGEPTPAATPSAAAQAGYELAGLVTGEGFDKQAADQLVTDTLQETVKVAADDADRVAAFIKAHDEEIEKQAMGEPPAAPGGGLPMGEPPADPPMGGGGEPPMGGGAPPMDPAAMMGGGEPPAPGGGLGGGGGLEQLAAVLEQLGITPEELIAALSSEAPPEGGGAPPAEGPPAGGPPEGGGGEGGGEPPAESPPEGGGGEEPPAEKAAGDGTTKKATASVADYIKELVSRSRQAA